MKIETRAARPDDLPGAFAVFEATAAEGRWIGTELPIDRTARLRRWAELLEDDSLGAMFVATLDGTVIGHAGLTWEHHPECGGGVLELGMTVVAEHRGQGVGSALMEACIGWARAVGAHKISLQVWPHNAAAIALYERFGFVREGYLRRHWTRRSGERWDSVVMGLLLDED